MNIDLSKCKDAIYEDSKGNIVSHDSPDAKYVYINMPCIVRSKNFYKYRPKNSIMKLLCQNKSIYKFISKYIMNFNDFDLKPFDLHYDVSWDSDLAQKCIVAMSYNHGYSLIEAIYVWSNSCERCRNVLVYRYLDKKDRGSFGYEEYSPKWFRCPSRCNHCKDMVEITEVDLDDMKAGKFVYKTVELPDEAMDIANIDHLNYLLDKHEIDGCGHCKYVFKEDDFNNISLTGNCPRCNSTLNKGIIKRYKVERINGGVNIDELHCSKEI